MSEPRRALIVRVGRYSGLGNRMRAVLSGHSLAEATGRNYRYCWPIGRHFGARMTQLWHYDQKTVPRIVPSIMSIRVPVRDAKADWRSAANAEPTWLIRTGQPIELPDGAVPWTERLRGLRLVDPLADRVREQFDAHLRDRPYIGVMVRAHPHSHEETKRHSPVSWFVDRMRQIRSTHPEVGFYVSCDVPSVQRDIVSQFDGAVGIEKPTGYNTAESLRGSVVDLYLLACSTYLLGPHYSSFPELAMNLCGPSLQLETSVTPASHALENSPFSVVSDPTRPSVRRS